jgi:hypothetical protein
LQIHVVTAQAVEVIDVKDFNRYNANSMERAAMVTRRTTPSGKAVSAVFVLLMFTFAFGVNGCSKQKTDVQRTDSGQNASSQVAGSQSVTTPTTPQTTPVTTIQPEIAKRKSVRGPVRKLPATLKYTDSDSGVSFSYPRKSMLETGEKAEQNSMIHEQLPMNFVEAGGETLVVLELPSSSHQETDSGLSLFSISVNKHLSGEQCAQFRVQAEPQKETQKNSEVENKSLPEPVLKRNLRGVEYSEIDKQTEHAAVKYYHRFVPGSLVNESGMSNSACYEFGLAANTEPRQDHENTSVQSKVDGKDAFSKLEKILASVDIRPDVDEKVAQAAKSESNPDEAAH